MSTRVADLLDHARERSFVGRGAELGAFGEALGGSGRRVLFLHGPGGIGKSSTLHEFHRRARALGRTVVAVDGRDVDPAPDAFRTALGTAGLPAGAVLLIDGYEHLAPLDGWLRRDFLPGRSDADVVVIAGREPPASAWRTDPGWRRLAAIRRLEPLDRADSAELLARAGVPAHLRDKLVALGRGHPLATALLADAATSGSVPRSLADVPDLITALLECLVREPPTDAHAAGLATCAKAWLTTEDLLRDTVGADAPAIWSWLCRRPFITAGPRGLRPHELARDVLDAEFERRSPDRYRALHRIVHDHAVAGIRTAAGPDLQLRAQHLLYLHRHSPLTATYYELRELGSVALLPGTPADHGEVVATVERLHGPAQAGLCRRWLAERPGGLSVIRDDDGLLAFVLYLTLPRGGDLEEQDPVTRAALRHVERAGPLRPGERIDLARYYSGVRDDQRDRYAVMAGSVSSIIEWIGRTRAWSFVVTTDPEFWGPMFEYLAFTRSFETTVDGAPHVVYGMDWRRLPVDDWLDLMNEREQTGGTGPAPAHLLRPPPLGRDAFADAVRQALRDLHRPERLAAGPLAGTAVAAGPGLRPRIEAAVAALGDEPKGAALRSVLDRTFLRPAASQEAAAEVLGLPFSTYRRHLAKAVDRLVDVLWPVEIGTEPGTD
ncbi:ATP-binding protein [Paractinoplanes rishiriensis]|uniref:Orc1-like AAA ATPase domain-containing protein n=1 Tax=Paractinoplanes rishiriensis TaxID=1050105 RepID=A0A919MXS4_9ACTN|nr:ATP-binding protein [Actinoplanes rishiriensis]GIE99263.1 hypothetical protein Ari01nite_67280 [Actinoplanes rishiriensis]